MEGVKTEENSTLSIGYGITKLKCTFPHVSEISLHSQSDQSFLSSEESLDPWLSKVGPANSDQIVPVPSTLFLCQAKTLIRLCNCTV